MNTVNESNYQDFEKAYNESIYMNDEKWNAKITEYKKPKADKKAIRIELDSIRDEREALIENSYKEENNYRIFWYAN